MKLTIGGLKHFEKLSSKERRWLMELSEAEICDGLSKITINNYGRKIILKLLNEISVLRESTNDAKWVKFDRKPKRKFKRKKK